MGRVYDELDTAHGARLLVDRLWPRGMRRDDPRVGAWHPQVAPSNELRRWYGHQPERHAEFTTRYEHELADPAMADALDAMVRAIGTGPAQLVTATRDVELSHLPALARHLANLGH
ncbi:DUF488 domain-containing protein [Aeromicrobium sp. A1-2]|nr:DUF488 domain-containing protein [Aeromicrobium sp. A1-2]